MSLILVIKKGSHFSFFWGLLLANSWIFLWKVLSRFFLYFSFISLWTLKNIQKQLSNKFLSLSSCLMLKKSRLRVISVKKKSNNSNLKLYLILTYHENQALRVFFVFLKLNGINSYFCIAPKNQHEPTLHFPG